MMSGMLIAVVGPSGVGKDSVMAGIHAALPQIQLVRRVITRAPQLGGETYDAVSPDAFAKAAENGAFCLYWGAHGLQYGIPANVLTNARAGRVCLANLSRSALEQAYALFPGLLVLHLTARPDVLAQRLCARGRETPQEVLLRLSKAHKPLPHHLHIIEISNNGTLDDTVAKAVAAIRAATPPETTKEKTQ